MNIILDMDGTLIDNIGFTPYARPHLKNFLNFCFHNFQHVSIWTAASPEWFQVVNQHIFQHLLEGRTFHFVWTRDRCTITTASYLDYDELDGRNNEFVLCYPGRIEKRLTKVYKAFKKQYNRHNTLIVDDLPETYSKNYGNAIPIHKYEYNNPDKSLIYLMKNLTMYKNMDIRSTDKRLFTTSYPTSTNLPNRFSS